jgi:hypothetical protein
MTDKAVLSALLAQVEADEAASYLAAAAAGAARQRLMRSIEGAYLAGANFRDLECVAGISKTQLHVHMQSSGVSRRRDAGRAPGGSATLFGSH